MLGEDVSRVIPYSSSGRRQPTIKIVDKSSEEVDLLVAKALAEEERLHPDLEDAVRAFLSQVAGLVILSDAVTCEIVYLSLTQDQESAGTPVAFSLALIRPGTFGHVGRKPVQFVPAHMGKPVLAGGVSYIDLDPRNLFTFRLDPKAARSVRTTVKFLKAAEDDQGAEFQLAKLAVEGHAAYNFGAHRVLQSELFAKATQSMGWDARGLFKERRLEPYGIWRQIQFLRFRIKLRESLLEQLNQAIAVAGEVVGFKGTLRIEGLPSVADADALEDALRSGANSFSDIATACI